MHRPLLLRLLLLALLTAVVAGCAANASFRKAESAAESGHWDDAVLQYLNAVENDPGNIKYRAALLRAKIKASQAHFLRVK